MEANNLDSVIKNLQAGASGILEFATKVQSSLSEEQKKEVSAAMGQLGNVSDKLAQAIKDLDNATKNI